MRENPKMKIVTGPEASRYVRRMSLVVGMTAGALTYILTRILLFQGNQEIADQVMDKLAENGITLEWTDENNN